MFCLMLLMLLICLMGEKQNVYAENVSVTIPANLDIIFHEDGSNTISEFTVENKSLLPITIHQINISEHGGWKLVPDGTTIPVNTKQLILKQNKASLVAGDNEVHILVPENSSKHLALEIERGAWTTSGVHDNVFDLEFKYTVGKKQFSLQLEGYQTLSIYNGECVSLPQPTKEGYEFAGWEDEGGNIYFDTYTMAVGNVTLKPIWKELFAYAIYSADDNSFTMVKTAETLTVGGTYHGKTITSFYSGIEDTNYVKDEDVPWYVDGVVYKVKKIIVQDKIKPKSTAKWFYLMQYCESADVRNLDLSNVTDMTQTFSYLGFFAKKFEWIGLEELDVSNVQNMTKLFALMGKDVSELKIDLSKWDVSNVTNMYQMFKGTACMATTFSLGDITVWDVSNVTNMKEMFEEVAARSSWSIDLRKWNVQKVTNHAYFNFLATDKVTPPNWVY